MDETGFVIERAGADSVFAVIGTVGTDVTRYVDATTPAAGPAYYRVAAVNGRGTSAYSNVVSVVVSNTPPALSSIASRTIKTSTTTGPMAFTVRDGETPPEHLTVSGASSNTALVASGGITFGGSGASRTVNVTPVAGRTGTATIKVTVSDGTLTASTVFAFTVTSGNVPPVISAIEDQWVTLGGTVRPLAFTIGDAETSAASLTLRATSSDTKLVPTSGIAFGGSRTNRTVTVRPNALRAGLATITVTVSDGTLTASESFRVTVQPLRAGSAAVATVAASAASSVVAEPVAASGIELKRLGVTSAAEPLTLAVPVVGTDPRAVLIRAVGPGLAALGVAGPLATPRIQILDTEGRLRREIGPWGGDTAVATASARLGLLPLDPAGADAAALLVLEPGMYTVRATAAGGTGGTVLLEVAELPREAVKPVPGQRLRVP